MTIFFLKRHLSRISEFLRISVVLAILLALFSQAAFARTLQSQASVGKKTVTSHVETYLVSPATLSPGDPLQMGWYFKLQPDWHIYWQNPGDSGEPPKLEWKLPPGFQVGALQFPIPQKIELPPLANYGYEQEALLIADVKVPKDLRVGQKIQFKATATWLVCKVECIPEQADLEISFIVGKKTQPDPMWQSKFLQTQQQQPKVLPQLTSHFTLTDQVFQLYFKDEKLQELIKKNPKVNFFPWKPGVIENASSVKIDAQKSELQLSRDPTNLEPIDQVAGLLVFHQKQNTKPQVYWLTAKSDSVGAKGVSSSVVSSFVAWPLLFAFLGGILLNLMPCVFPVLSIKVLNFLKKSQHDQKTIQIHAWVYTGGVLISFWLLVGALLLLRQGGEQLGWGFHLQSPVFLVILIDLIFLFSLSLWGVFEIGSSWMGLGSNLSQSSGYMGSFWTGIFATLVATPCMAPLMGSAIGYALTRSTLEIFLIFTLIALGMALPYLLLCYFPYWRKFLPKPGNWMQSFQQAMGFLLAATILWLLWVLSFMIGSDGILQVLSGILVLAGFIWLATRFKRSRFFKTLFALIGIGLSLWVGLPIASHINDTKSPTSYPSHNQLNWEAFSEQKLAQYLDEGKPVFLDFTAAWCISCQVNERLVLQSAAVRKAFSDYEVALLKADWTLKDEKIAKVLANYGRQGVPLYVYYAKGKKNRPVILPEILTKNTVLELFSPAHQNENQ